MELETKISRPVYLSDTNLGKSVFLQIKNSNQDPTGKMKENIISHLKSKNYTLLDTPENAHYLLQANLVQLGQADFLAAKEALEHGFGADISNVDRQAKRKTLALEGENYSTYTVVADIQISEKVNNTIANKEEKEGVETFYDIHDIEWNRYTTRVVSSIRSEDLNFEEMIKPNSKIKRLKI